ncbi:MAG: hydrogenase maturation nickel metallochaperone HypA [Phycisphaerae bacterium]|jgi:hydrogenase nickel incorporation protein HypA/HybF
MHETMIAKNLLDTLEAEATKQNAKPKIAKISCGTFNTVNDEILTFAFEAIAKGTTCEGVKLEIEHKPITAKCGDCGKIFAFDLTKPVCEHCGSDKYDLLPDAPLLLDEIEFDTE